MTLRTLITKLIGGKTVAKTYTEQQVDTLIKQAYSKGQADAAEIWKSAMTDRADSIGKQAKDSAEAEAGAEMRRRIFRKIGAPENTIRIDRS